ncbi:2-C-methyl-D-erythritol 4-phosphate cytidylyltransferase [Bifidobacterium animalis subsp. lactis ATCC 27673]|uniref:2-C-methyl-D-erythritol 4-phosphate cytidylyltransferase n=1 Tax=Bifidobacterium animalis subsp. lactis TaxID=302911 RepID=A0A8B3RKG5_BIFAN|nr:IspD/TarI family cytidylyltransferase [Bifidobacterium animalis]AGW84556.1 2-C-methyl-D-erythritol 4-phosphate cytidylyltransferase [Bifidobacterium animalis subsp. lactis ATCC 27673]KOA47190.1 2-C-methyl-D-erythritol 4-phosphate cytidylyltransferase [Bifidobacterium animalis subsp. lactis ATCC 27673]RYM93981.1 2-C-methyl-D-erythritol 4-phosphate cytidylyltransferase [Bifidobacterium animalis subsp. lactis]RYM94177.1 2-C-methyl-D-erythritol 4-phosphate cytidylyltransferase [Bifidobacterium a
MTQQTKVPVVAVVLAAGSGVRFDPAKPKQLVALNGKPIVAWSIEAFENDEHVDDIVVVVNNTVREAVEQLIDDASYAKVRAIITGGAERSDSTEAALTTLADAGIPQDAKILIHDAVRPFVSRQEIDGCIDALDEFTAATVACPSTDTILLTQDLGDREVIQSVPERRHSFRAQTPQAFRFGTIRDAYAKAAGDPDFRPTDDTRVVVDYLPDQPVAIVGGSPRNMKVTTQDDMPLARALANALAGAPREPQNERQRAAKEQLHAMFGKAFGVEGE